MATLTLNAAIGSGRKVTVTASTSGSLSGTMALLVDNTINKGDLHALFEALERTLHRRLSKAAKVSGMSTSLVTIE